jgi:hypothetical protein
VVDRQGWPLRSKVGEQAATAAWLLAQHADARPDFQRRCLHLLTVAVDHGEADPAHLAYLTDRVLCGEGRPSVTAPSSGKARTAPPRCRPSPSTTPTTSTSAEPQSDSDRSPTTSGTCSRPTGRTISRVLAGACSGRRCGSGTS